MNISQQYKCIFIHVNKTAGRSVSTTIFGDIKEHLTSKELFDLYDTNPTEERLKIITILLNKILNVKNLYLHLVIKIILEKKYILITN